jgi:hypothetical protein
MIAQAHARNGAEPEPPRGLWSDVRALYRELDAEVARLGPVCQISGRCCRFQEHGHTLFVSQPELEFLLREGPQPIRPLDDGLTCPWQDTLGRCTARQARPLGCRVYYCDPAYEPHGSELSERYIARLKRLAERYGVAWNYAPLHRHLHRAREQGALALALASALPT